MWIMMYKVKKEMVPNYILELFNTQKKGYEATILMSKDLTQQDSENILLNVTERNQV